MAPARRSSSWVPSNCAAASINVWSAPDCFKISHTKSLAPSTDANCCATCAVVVGKALARLATPAKNGFSMALRAASDFARESIPTFPWRMQPVAVSEKEYHHLPVIQLNSAPWHDLGVWAPFHFEKNPGPQAAVRTSASSVPNFAGKERSWWQRSSNPAIVQCNPPLPGKIRPSLAKHFSTNSRKRSSQPRRIGLPRPFHSGWRLRSGGF